ncbi:unnamed protein product [Closterium sp. NIES-53]
MYLMTCTRPDLAYPLSILARYLAPGRHRPEHMAAAKRVLRYLCSTSGMGLVLGGRSPVVLTGHAYASWADDQATQRSSQGYTFGLGSGSVSWRATRSSSVLGSSCGAEIYAGAMAAQELRWLTYLLTDLGETPRSPPFLYVDNKAMLALCREQRLEHRTKHIALRYFLARELQQRGQLRLAYVAYEANTADVFTKALAPCDHQRCCTQLGLLCFALLDWSCDAGGREVHRAPFASELRRPDEAESSAWAAWEESDDDDKGGRERSVGRRPCQENKPRKEKQSTKSTTLAKDADSSSGGKGRGDREASCSLVRIVEPTVSLTPEAREDFRAVAANVQANSVVLLLKSGCSHHLRGTKEAFVDLGLSGVVKHVHGFNGSCGELAVGQPAAGQRRATVGRWHRDAARLSDGGRASSGKIHRLGPLHQPSPLHDEVDGGHHGDGGPVDDRLRDEVDAGHVARKAGSRWRRHSQELGSDTDGALAVVHINLCGSFKVAAKDGSLYFLLLKDRKTRYVWVKPTVKKFDLLWVFEKWLLVVERQTKNPDLTLARVWGCMVQFMLPEQQRGRKLGAEGQVGPSSRCVAGEQRLGGPRRHRQQGRHYSGGDLLRDHVAGDVEVGVRAGVRGGRWPKRYGFLHGDILAAR